jgi:molecular chaperone GrpE
MLHGDVAMEKGIDEAASIEEEVPEQGEEMEVLRLELEELRKSLEEERESSQKFLDSAKRIQADFDNFKKRQQREMERVVACAGSDIIGDLLTIVDDFERALSVDDSAEFRQGVKRIHDNLVALLRSNGLREVPTDSGFDSSLHDAIAVDEGEEGEILEVYQKGYFLGDRVLRYSKVKVGKNKGESD